MQVFDSKIAVAGNDPSKPDPLHRAMKFTETQNDIHSVHHCGRSALFLAGRGLWRRTEITALAVAKVPNKIPTSKLKELF